MLAAGIVRMHPFVIGELAMGNLNPWQGTIDLLGRILPSRLASHDEFFSFMGAGRLMGSGIGFVDAHLLAAAVGQDGLAVWTRDKRLLLEAETLGVAYRPIAPRQ